MPKQNDSSGLRSRNYLNEKHLVGSGSLAAIRKQSQVGLRNVISGLLLDHEQTGSWPIPVRRRKVRFNHLGISDAGIRANPTREH